MKAVLISCITSSLITVLLATTHANTAGIEVRVAQPSDSEQYEREVDHAALASQTEAISKLRVLAKRYEGSKQEPTLLIKLAELQQQEAAIHFRIAHGIAHRSKTPLNLTRYSRVMTQSIGTLDRLIRAYPLFEEMPRAYFMRGKANEEIGNKAAATHNYLHLSWNFPNADETPSAHMALAQFSIDTGEHAKAVTYLREVERLADNPHYPFALYKLAWAHYNLRDIPLALSYAERHIAYLSKQLKPDTMGSEAALRENSLLDISLFYFQGYEDGNEAFKLNDALSYFRGQDRGTALGKMVLRFAKLLRSGGHDVDLVTWKDQVLAEESTRNESLDVLITTYEHQLNKRRYSQLIESTQNMAKLYLQNKGFESFPRARQILLDTAEGLQAVIIKNKGTDETLALSATLAAIYDGFTKIVEETDPRIPRVHYNLAETLFTVKDYAGASEHYRWIVEHGNTIPDAALKAVSARYEVLKQKELISLDLLTQVITDAKPRPLDRLLSEWIEWVDALSKATSLASSETFQFEVSRALYASGHLPAAIARLIRFAKSSPNSSFAIPSASLVLDTYIAGSEWKDVYELSNSFLAIRNWKENPFYQRLTSVAADSYYKLIEESFHKHDFATVLSQAEEFIARYQASPRLGDCLLLAGNAAMESNDKPRALRYFSLLIHSAPESTNTATALLARAAIEEDRYMFSEAAADYRAYLGLAKETGSKVEAIRRKTLILSWLSGNSAALRIALESSAVCPELGSKGYVAECESYRAILAYEESTRDSNEITTLAALARARKESGDARTLWAATTLNGSRHLSFRDRLLAVRIISAGWETLDPIIRFALLPGLSISIPRAFQQATASMSEAAPLRADEKHITRRVEAIHEVENAATVAMKLPWARIRAEVMNEIASLYSNLAKDFFSLSPPKGMPATELAAYHAAIRNLIVPFEEKGQDLRLKAFETASKASIEDEAFQRIAVPFFSENPSQARSLRADSGNSAPISIDLWLVPMMDPHGKWDSIIAGRDTNLENPALRIQSLWAKALRDKRWPQVAFFLQEAQEKALIQAGVLAAIKSVSLASAGARAEALAELNDARRDLSPEARALSSLALIQYALRSSNLEGTSTLLSELRSTTFAPDQARAAELWIASAAAYVDLSKH